MRHGGRDADRARGEAVEAGLRQVRHRRPFAHAGNDEAPVDLLQQFIEIGIDRRVVAHDGVLDGNDGAVLHQPGKIARRDELGVLHIGDERPAEALGKPADADRHAGRGRRKVQRQQHGGGECRALEHIDLVFGLAVVGADRGDDPAAGRRDVLELVEQRAELAHPHVVEVGIAAIERRRHPARRQVRKDAPVAFLVERVVRLARQRRHRKD